MGLVDALQGNYVKDLCCLGRALADTIIVDNSPHSYVFQPDNALPIGTFIDDPDDQVLQSHSVALGVTFAPNGLPPMTGNVPALGSTLRGSLAFQYNSSVLDQGSTPGQYGALRQSL